MNFKINSWPILFAILCSCHQIVRKGLEEIESTQMRIINIHVDSLNRFFIQDEEYLSNELIYALENQCINKLEMGIERDSIIVHLTVDKGARMGSVSDLQLAMKNVRLRKITYFNSE